MESVSDGLVKCLFLFNGSTSIERQLNKNAILCAPDTKIVFVGDEGVGRMLGNNLKTIVLGHRQNIDHRLIDDGADGATIFGGLSLDEIDAGERHMRFLGDRLSLTGRRLMLRTGGGVRRRTELSGRSFLWLIWSSSRVFNFVKQLNQ